ncbi:MAG: hypothetical protein HOL98_01240 [Gammaproteobacteria bacterium]|jgi:hypothetical protein|nr:hypothetical protein [Gammaproteobacteria bacterium]MBT5202053.1 hypothetical protein [Gammaproteobacteria bacterium]MBT5603055.1 hypothetical protein [Gammaproteobacteria bacterium]MBT6245337.1 hypothetical protein [Gammaproteobacteria bacterium]
MPDEKAPAIIAVLVVLIIASLYVLLDTDTIIPVEEATIAPVEKDHTRTWVSASMTNCSRSGQVTRVEGEIVNRGNVPVTMVTVQSIWKNDQGQVVDTGLIYVLSEESILQPGESKTFMDTTELRNISRCNVRALDWWAGQDRVES